jgi:hypothetical protein
VAEGADAVESGVIPGKFAAFAFTWSRDGIDRNGCPSSGLLILSRVIDRQRRRFAPLTRSTDRKNSLSVAINALLCLSRLSVGEVEAPT